MPVVARRDRAYVDAAFGARSGLVCRRSGVFRA
jgi:hypothetical protein